MAREFNRSDRLAEQIQRELGGVLLTEVSDPTLKRMLVSGVEVSRDLAYAKVFVTLMQSMIDGEPTLTSVESERESVEGLRRASGFLRRTLASKLRIRAVPELRFEIDKTLDEAARIDRLLSTELKR
ncbi:MAG: ribosome-binding factor A [Gammaproteobacteria bacterium]|jgi:ribosome-binding factor A